MDKFKSLFVCDMAVCDLLCKHPFMKKCKADKRKITFSIIYLMISRIFDY